MAARRGRSLDRPESHCAACAATAPPPLQPTATADAFQADRPSKRHVIIFLSATVFDRAVTEIRWFGSGGESRIFSSIDFNLLAGLGGFETADASYSLIMGLGNDTRAARIENERIRAGDSPSRDPLPAPAEFSPVRAEDLVAEGAALNPPSADDLNAMDALHVYFDANRQQLVASHAAREVTRVAHAQWLKEHPPKPKDTVIYYWKKPLQPKP